ncbi:hypothetical protein [Bacillus sp. 2205SS5-2]|uniref:hypothetical protein n=1 Tax=Bacillus sp. 2205SS5-2 TaxID=3109031 RepID=UPI00300540EC
MSQHFIMDLINLPDFDLVRMSQRSEGWVAILRPTLRSFLCPICGSRSIPHKRGKTRTLRHRVTPHFGFICVEVPCYHEQCTNCFSVWSVKWEGIPQRGKSTELFKEITSSLCHETTIQAVSRAYQIPYTTLERWYYQWAERQNEVISRRRNTPKIICLDDFSRHSTFYERT